MALIICTQCYDRDKSLSYLIPGEPDEKGRTTHTCQVCGHKEVTIEQSAVGTDIDYDDED
ncbi:MAG: hypothetical protein ACI3ZR_01125 [bacterium]